MENIHKNILHLEPSRGLLDDPNGLVQFNGKYYVFHQWNRFGLDHSYKEWGLFTSSDLLHWHHEGSAILPDSMLDKDGRYKKLRHLIQFGDFYRLKSPFNSNQATWNFVSKDKKSASDEL